MITQYIRKDSFVKDFVPCPDISARSYWDALPGDLRDELIRSGEKYLNFSWEPVLASDYMEFTRSGNRTAFEKKYSARRCALDALVLAECAENSGRFLEAAVNGLYCIMEEGTWCIPAHNSLIRDAQQNPLPDYAAPVIDLFAAETGAVLAVSEYLLRPSLRELSPLISHDIDFRLRERIFDPYINRHFWWMGDGESQMNNWTVWITQNILLAAFTRGGDFPDRDLKNEFLMKASRSIDYFLDEYGEDGCCSEGAQYYSHAALTMYVCLEIIDAVTDGALTDVFSENKIRNMADYIRRVHIAGKYYVNFADCSPCAGYRGAREYLFGRRAGLPELCAFAASDFQRNPDPLLSGEQSLYLRLLQIIHWEEIRGAGTGESGEDFYFPGTGLMVARDRNLFLAVKAGNNGDSHNHNDTGSFIVYRNGSPLFIDLGVETYCRKTFSAQRYEIWTMQSQYHNLPSPGGFLQQAGKEYAAGSVRCSITPECAVLSMDIAGAYRLPGSQEGSMAAEDGSLSLTAGADRIRSYRRSAALYYDHAIIIEDTYDGDLPCTMNLMTFVQPALSRIPGGYMLSFENGGVCLAKGAVSVHTETIPLHDPRLSSCWGPSAFRIRIQMDKVLCLEIR